MRILSLDGGGVRGVASLTILSKLEEKTGRATHELFDVIGGTSTGAILAVLLGLLKVPAKDCIEIYNELSHELFDKRHCILTRVLLYLQKDSSRLGQLTSRILSEHLNLVDEDGGKIGDPASIRLNDFPTDKFPKVFLVTYDATNKCTTVLRNYHIDSEPSEAGFCDATRSPFAPQPFPGISDMPLRQAVLASTAAPTYFEPVSYQDTVFIDGGVGCNNPSMLALAEVAALNFEPDVLISLGTGLKTNAPKHIHETTVKEIADMALDSSDSERIHSYVTNLSRLIPLTYTRFNPDGVGNYELDDVTHYNQMKKLTAQYCRTEAVACQLGATSDLLVRKIISADRRVA